MYGLFQQTLIQGLFSAFFVGQRPKAFSAQFRVQARLKALLFTWSLKSKTYKKKLAARLLFVSLIKVPWKWIEEVEEARFTLSEKKAMKAVLSS